MPPLYIRPYQQSDWDMLCSIHDRARLDELRNSVGVEAFLTLEQTAQSEGLFDGELWVAELGGRVVGFVAFRSDELTWLYVDPDDYRRGIGTALLHHALARGEPHFKTEVLVGNTAALQLYLREGFRIVGRRDGRLMGNETFAAAGYELVRDLSANSAAD